MKFNLAALSVVVLGFGATQAFAGHLGDTTCDPSWKICVQSYVMNSTETVHFITGMKADNEQFTLPPSNQFSVANDSQNVILQTQGQPDLVIGQINEPVGGDAATAMSRELILAPGFDINVDAQPGKLVTYCNTTAFGLTNHSVHKTTAITVTFLRSGQTVGELNSMIVQEPEVANYFSPFPCSSN